MCRDADLDRAARGHRLGRLHERGPDLRVGRARLRRAAGGGARSWRRCSRRRAALRLEDEAGAGEVGPMTLERQRRDRRGPRRRRGGAGRAGAARRRASGAARASSTRPRSLTGRRPRHDASCARRRSARCCRSWPSTRSTRRSGWRTTATTASRRAAGPASAQTAARLQRELVAGVVVDQRPLSSFGEPHAPWGGVKASGIGRIHGRAGLREMVQREVRERRPRPRSPRSGGIPTTRSTGR